MLFIQILEEKGRKERFGFREGRSDDRCHLSYETSDERRWEYGKHTLITFIDLKQKHKIEY